MSTTLTTNELTARAGKNAARWLHDIAGVDFCAPLVLCEVARGSWSRMVDRAGIPTDCAGWVVIALLPPARYGTQWAAVKVDDATKGAAGITVGNLRAYRERTLSVPDWRTVPDTLYTKGHAEERRKGAQSAIIIAQRAELVRIPQRAYNPDATIDCRIAHAAGKIRVNKLAPHHIRLFSRLAAYKRKKRLAEVAAHNWDIIADRLGVAAKAYFFELQSALRNTTDLATFTRLAAVADNYTTRPGILFEDVAAFRRKSAAGFWSSVDAGECWAEKIAQDIDNARAKVMEALA